MNESLPSSVKGRTWLAFKWLPVGSEAAEVIEIPWAKPKSAIYSRLRAGKSLFGCKVAFVKGGNESRPNYALEFIDGDAPGADVLELASETRVHLEALARGENPFVRDDDSDQGEDEIEL